MSTDTETTTDTVTRSRGRPAKVGDAEFADIWQKSESVEAAAASIGEPTGYASYRASYLRKHGYPNLKDMRATRRKTDEEKWESIPQNIRDILGKQPDPQVGAIAGVTRERVRQWRALRGIAKFTPQKSTD